MKKWLILWLVLNTACQKADIAEYVDPNIGGVAPLLTTKTPTVHRPHSMARVFPVTKPGLGDRYLSDKIYGFAINMPAYRMGQVTELMAVPGEWDISKSKNASSLYDHDHEEVHPWYHKVWLEDHEVMAEWSTTKRAVIYRFHFQPGKTGNIIFRGNHDAAFSIPDSVSVSGWEEFSGSRQYFYARFSNPAHRFGMFREDTIFHDRRMIGGEGCGAWVSFEHIQDPLEIRIGISFIDVDQARQNLINETDGKSFKQVADQSHRTWSETLNRIRVSGGTQRQMRIFYTSLYRASERMVDISEYGRYYSGYDKKVHESKGRFYVDDWLWDTFRSQHPLLSILDPGRQAEMVQSYVTMFEQSGWMPGFPQFYGDFPAMIGFHSAALVWDSYQKGITYFDVEKAYQGLKKNAMEATMLPWRSGPMCSLDSFYHEHGWYPALPEDSVETVSMVHDFEKRQAVALTLEHSYDDWCLAQLARALNKLVDYEYFMARSRNWRNVYHPETGFMSPRMADGDWVDPFDPKLSGGYGSRMYFAENNAWIWNYNVMHDIPGLIELMGGNEVFTERLDALFNEPAGIAKWLFMGQFPDASGLNGMFPAGNEPAFHVPYLYNYAGKPWKTQRRIREIMDLWFDDSPRGLPGDEDGGALCAWYVLSAMGFYPVTPGTGLYAIGSPVFENIRILLPDGKTFVIKAKHSSMKNKYIQSARLNGEVFDRAWIRHSEIAAGGILELEMGDRPNKDWAGDPALYGELLLLNNIQ